MGNQMIKQVKPKTKKKNETPLVIITFDKKETTVYI